MGNMILTLNKKWPIKNCQSVLLHCGSVRTQMPEHLVQLWWVQVLSILSVQVLNIQATECLPLAQVLRESVCIADRVMMCGLSSVPRLPAAVFPDPHAEVLQVNR